MSSSGHVDGVGSRKFGFYAGYPVRDTAWRLWVGEGPDPTPDESTGGGGKKGGGHPRKKRESRITWAVIFAVIVRARADIN